MSKPALSFHQSRDAFLKALHDYHAATLDMNQALHRVTQHTQAFCTPLRHIVQNSGARLAPDQRNPQATL